MVAPIYPVYLRNADKSIKIDKHGYKRYDFGDGSNAGLIRPVSGNANALQTVTLDTNNSEGNAINGTAYFEIKFLKDFTFTFNAGLGLDETRGTSINNMYYGQFATNGGIISKSHGRSFYINLQQLLNWNRRFGNHNVGTKRDKNYVYVLFQSMQDPTQYAIRRTSGTLGNFNSSDKKDFTTETLNMDQNSIVVNTWNSSDVYYTYNNKIWRWGLNIEPPTDPTLSIDEGEIICVMGTNFMGDYGDRGTTDETWLYVASYNEATKKGSLYIFDIKTQTLVEKYQDVCDRPVKLLYKYRIS